MVGTRARSESVLWDGKTRDDASDSIVLIRVREVEGPRWEIYPCLSQSDGWYLAHTLPVILRISHRIKQSSAEYGFPRAGCRRSKPRKSHEADTRPITHYRTTISTDPASFRHRYGHSRFILQTGEKTWTQIEGEKTQAGRRGVWY